jgi:hypothetical protein
MQAVQVEGVQEKSRIFAERVKFDNTIGRVGKCGARLRFREGTAATNARGGGKLEAVLHGAGRVWA